MIAELVGFKSFEEQFTLNSSGLSLDIQLKESVNEMNAVVITAGTFEASDRKKATVLNPIDIVTTASANADITGRIENTSRRTAGRRKRGAVCTGRNSYRNKNIY